ncbi:8467_t:CDS:2 [Entrophospora sp. SA101]|nr:8958_t:CDS:2 [Entrophospora sp. SA101]CAJ0841862.1 8467_t:CDS:2 [Entrophospora sp. SA101]
MYYIPEGNELTDIVLIISIDVSMVNLRVDKNQSQSKRPKSPMSTKLFNQSNFPSLVLAPLPLE